MRYLPLVLCVVALLTFWYVWWGRRRRYRALQAMGKCIDLDAVLSGRESVAALVTVDFGFGIETWAFTVQDFDLDHPNRQFRHGRAIYPPPSRRVRKIICAQHGCTCESMMITFEARSSGR